jgi:hypothetical protein
MNRSGAVGVQYVFCEWNLDSHACDYEDLTGCDEGQRANILYVVFLIPVGSSRALFFTLYHYHFFL